MPFYEAGRVNFFAAIADLRQPAAFRLTEFRRRECCGFQRLAGGIPAHARTPGLSKPAQPARPFPSRCFRPSFIRSNRRGT